MYRYETPVFDACKGRKVKQYDNPEDFGHGTLMCDTFSCRVFILSSDSSNATETIISLDDYSSSETIISLDDYSSSETIISLDDFES